jgi:hypothetical protein
MVNWKLLLDSENSELYMMEKFALGEASARNLTALFAHGEFAGEFRNLIRNHGVDMARKLTRRALRRRGLITA